MDGALLFQLLGSTLSASTEERTLAEKRLQELKSQPGFAVFLLQLVANANVDISIRQAASIYFKNLVQRNWAPLTDEDEDDGEELDDAEDDEEENENEGKSAPAFIIREQDKVVIRANLVESIIHAPTNTRAQLLTALGKVVIADYPTRFKELLPKLMSYLTSNDQQLLQGALLSLYELVRKYEFKGTDDRGPMMKVVATTFPVLHQLFTTCLQFDSPEAATILKLIAKIYYACIQYSLPKELRATENFTPWVQGFLQLIEKPAPPVPTGTDPSLKHKFPWWQAKKWAHQIFNRFFSRYGNPALTDKEYKKFAKDFLVNYAPQILQTYLKELDNARTGSYISPRVLQLILLFVTDAIEHAKTWKPMKGIVIDVVKTIVFPLLCFSDTDQELWDEDPYEYVRTKFDLYEDFKNPVPAAMGFVQQLASQRKKFALIPILSFCNDILLNYHASPPQQKNHRHKDGALCMIGAMSSILEKDENFSSQLEGLLVAHVFPEANSPAPYLRARACWTIYNFAEVAYTNSQNILQALHVVAKCMKDPELPVKIEAALALGMLVIRDEVQEHVRPILGDVMQELLNITNESDIDDLSTVMETMIEVFGSEMAPFAVHLCTQLRNTFMRLIGEAEGEDDENKAVSAMGILRTIVTLVRFMDDSTDILSQLEIVLLPMMQNVLDQVHLDYMEEILEMVTTFTYNSDKITPTMWSIFPSLFNCFKNGAQDYFSEMLPCFDNYISRDPQGFVSNPHAVNMMIELIHTIIEGDNSGEVDKANACQLMEVFLLNLPGSIDQLVPGFIEMSYKLVADAEITLLRVCSLEVVINAIYYNPRLALQVLEAKGWTAAFFTTWFQNIQKFSRVHDIKLCVLALCKLFQIPHAEVPPMIQAGYPQAMTMIIGLFKALPKAYEYRKELEELEDDETDDEDEDEIVDDDYEPEVGDDEDVFSEQDAAQLESLRERAKRDEEDEYDGDDIDVEEDLETTTPLDDINEYIAFQETLRGLQSSNHATFAALTRGLDQPQAQFLHQLSAIADQKRVELAQAKPQ